MAATRSLLLDTPDDGDRRFLLDELERFAGLWPGLVQDDPLGISIVHADLHSANAIASSTGVRLIDLELAGVGPASYDLGAMAVAGRRYGATAASVEEAFARYGSDPRSWSGFAALCDVYELWVTAWAVATRGRGPAAEIEARRRIARWRTGGSRTWTLR